MSYSSSLSEDDDEGGSELLGPVEGDDGGDDGDGDDGSEGSELLDPIDGDDGSELDAAKFFSAHCGGGWCMLNANSPISVSQSSVEKSSM